jgi:hypothetical protein
MYYQQCKGNVMVLSVSWVALAKPLQPNAVPLAIQKKKPKWATELPIVTTERTMEINGKPLEFWKEGQPEKIVLVWVRNK